MNTMTGRIGEVYAEKTGKTPAIIKDYGLGWLQISDIERILVCNVRVGNVGKLWQIVGCLGVSGKIDDVYTTQKGNQKIEDPEEYAEGWMQTAGIQRVRVRYTRVSHSACFWQVIDLPFKP